MKKNKISSKLKILAGLLILGSITFAGFILYLRLTCIDSNEQCKRKPDGTKCEYGKWCDQFGRVCAGQSCVGLGMGKCFREKCTIAN